MHSFQSVAPPSQLLNDLSVHSYYLLRGGGTPAEVWRIKTDANDTLVVKLLHHDAGIVDGHDPFSFILKAKQISQIHLDLPDLSPYYISVLRTWQTQTWSAYAMPFVNGVPLSDLLQTSGNGQQMFDATLYTVLLRLTEFGYATRSVLPPSSYFQAMNLNRINRRLDIIRTWLGHEFVSEMLIVNEVCCLSLPLLISQMSADQNLMSELQPALLYYPVHGDLNLGNILVDSAIQQGGQFNFTVIDPRGTLDNWDVIYDFAKILFSLTVYELAMQRCFHIRRSWNKKGYGQYALSLCGRPHLGYQNAASNFIELISSLPFVKEQLAITESDRWISRLMFTLAFHALAESACRLSDRKHRTYSNIAGWEACTQLATGLYLVGLLLLNRLYHLSSRCNPVDVLSSAFLPYTDIEHGSKNLGDAVM